MVQAHPRVSGENELTSNVGSVVYGSSPRERGKPSWPVTQTFNVGLIPA